MCKNFGIPFEGPAAGGAGTRRADPRYSVPRSKGSVSCRHCGQSFTPHSNEAIRPVLKHFLSQSIPFAACSKRECRNYGRNIFWEYARYRKHGRSYGAKCRKCKSSVTLGASLGLHVDKDTRKKIKFILFAFLLGAKKRRTVHFVRMFFVRIITSGYYKTLTRIGSRLRSYHSWRNARLADRRAPVDFSQTARVYTDVVQASLRRDGDVKKHRNISVIVSVLGLKKTYYILAAHPYFLPHRYGPESEEHKGEQEYDPVSGLPSPEFTRKWACLEHPVHDRFGRYKTPEEMMAKMADMSRKRDGFYINKAYAEIAHFLVVKTMLRRFKRICFYMDGDKAAMPSAMVGLSDGIRSRRIEVVLFQRLTKKGKHEPEDPIQYNMGAIGSAERRKALRKCWAETEPRVQGIFEAGESPYAAGKAQERHAKKKSSKPRKTPAEQFPDPEQRTARVFKSAVHGAFSGPGSWAWLHFPAPMGREITCRTHWLTRMPGKTFEDGEEAMLYSTLQPVDSSMGAMRQRVRSIRRPSHRAAQGRGFANQYYDPQVLLAELSIYLYARNYILMADDQKVTPAEVLGLKPGHPGFDSLTDLIMKFQLDRPHAEKMSKWRLR